jgi:S1-C subfamily serine protease
MRNVFLVRRFEFGMLLVVLVCTCVHAQSPPPRGPAAPQTPTIFAPQAAKPGAPLPRQVVTVVHRLNGLKVLRMLRRSGQRGGSIEILNDPVIAGSVHTSIIAGLAMGDGHSVVAFLPRAEAEVETPVLANLRNSITSLSQNDTSTMAPPSLSDLTIMPPDGGRIQASYVGLDGFTGLSVLNVDGLTSVVQHDAGDENLRLGQRVRLFAPRAAGQNANEVNESKGAKEGRLPAAGTMLMRVGEVQGLLAKITLSPSGNVARLTISANQLSPEMLGAIALNEQGETLGIVESLDSSGARVLPTKVVRRAAERVIALRCSVPRPWIGIGGQAVSDQSSAQLMSAWWSLAEATKVLNDRRGILLTSVIPGTPAEQAKLRPGDIIMRVNDDYVQSAEDLSWVLSEADVGSALTFTVLRGDHLDAPPPAPDQMTLGGVPSIAPRAFAVTVNFPKSLPTPLAAFDASAYSARTVILDPLAVPGVETIRLSPMVASQFGGQSGLLVIFVEPGSRADIDGLLPGDLIESINGISPASLTAGVKARANSGLRLSVIRAGKRLNLNLKIDDAKK